MRMFIITSSYAVDQNIKVVLTEEKEVAQYGYESSYLRTNLEFTRITEIGYNQNNSNPSLFFEEEIEMIIKVQNNIPWNSNSILKGNNYKDWKEFLVSKLYSGNIYFQEVTIKLK